MSLKCAREVDVSKLSGETINAHSARRFFKAAASFVSSVNEDHSKGHRHQKQLQETCSVRKGSGKIFRGGPRLAARLEEFRVRQGSQAGKIK
jgi:hypothetical protein